MKNEKNNIFNTHVTKVNIIDNKFDDPRSIYHYDDDDDGGDDEGWCAEKK